MTDLTEQCKKGKLESGFYYVYLKYLEMFDITTSSTLFGILERGNENCLEIIAPVPSYEEWQAKDKENQQLKELLKECIPYFNALVEKRLKLEYIPQVYELLSKINEVLR